MESGTKRVLLIILTILVVGPLVFFGACYPLGILGFGLSFGNTGHQAVFGTILFFGAWIIAALLAIFVIYKIIKKINQTYDK